jgi:hypothetical protein
MKKDKIILTICIIVGIVFLLVKYGPMTYIISNLIMFGAQQERILDNLKQEDLNQIAKDCVYLLKQYSKDERTELAKNDPNIPEAIKKINPVYVWIDGKRESVMVALMGGVGHSGLELVKDRNSKNEKEWVLRRYWDEGHEDLMRLNIDEATKP